LAENSVVWEFANPNPTSRREGHPASVVKALGLMASWLSPLIPKDQCSSSATSCSQASNEIVQEIMSLTMDYS